MLKIQKIRAIDKRKFLRNLFFVNQGIPEDEDNLTDSMAFQFPGETLLRLLSLNVFEIMPSVLFFMNCPLLEGLESLKRLFK